MSGVVVGGVGVAALREVKDRRELPLALLPLAFAIHQVTEGFVWLSLEGKVSESTGDVAMYSYLFYAWALLPFFAPLAIWLVEPSAWRRRCMAGLMVVGAGWAPVSSRRWSRTTSPPGSSGTRSTTGASAIREPS